MVALHWNCLSTLSWPLLDLDFFYNLRFFNPKFLWDLKIFWTQNVFWDPTFFFYSTFCDGKERRPSDIEIQNFSRPNVYQTQNVSSTRNLFQTTNIFLIEKFFGNQFFLDQTFSRTPIFFTKHSFCGPTIFFGPKRDWCIMSPLETKLLYIVLFHEDITQLDQKDPAIGIHAAKWSAMRSVCKQWVHLYFFGHPNLPFSFLFFIHQSYLLLEIHDHHYDIDVSGTSPGYFQAVSLAFPAYLKDISRMRQWWINCQNPNSTTTQLNLT